MKKSILPQPCILKSLKRKNYIFAGDVVVDGDVDISGTMIVGGDVHVKGACRVDILHCLGHVTVEGTLSFGSIHLLGVLECHGEASGIDLHGATEPDGVFAETGKPAGAEAALDYFRQREAASLFTREKNAYFGGGGQTVKINENLTVERVVIHGGFEVGANFTFKKAQIHGSTSIGGSLEGDKLWMSGSANVEKAVIVRKRLLSLSDLQCRWYCIAGEIEVQGDLDAGYAIVCKGDLVVGGHVRTGNRIQVRGALSAGKSIQSTSSIYAGKTIKAGKDFGIHAGMSVPAQLQGEHGYVCAPAKPGRIRTGTHVTYTPFKKLTPRQLICWPADDGADGVEFYAGRYISD